MIGTLTHRPFAALLKDAADDTKFTAGPPRYFFMDQDGNLFETDEQKMSAHLAALAGVVPTTFTVESVDRSSGTITFNATTKGTNE